MDAIIKELATLPPREVPRLIRAGMEQEEDVLHDAPPLFREFFTETCLNDPPWLDHDAFVPGIRAFHANVTDILAGFVAGVLVDGFSTLIAKSFVATGRVIDAGTRRLQQNNRHLVEIFFPGGLDRVGDGWKLSVRIRIIHARVRHLLDQSGRLGPGRLGHPDLRGSPRLRGCLLLRSDPGAFANPRGRLFEGRAGELLCRLAVCGLAHGNTRDHPVHQ